MMASMTIVPAINSTHMKLPGQTGFYRGKVRDVYFLGEKLLMVATDRISAFDHILPAPIPFKGQVLNQIAGYFLDSTKDIVPNWLCASPDPNVSYGYLCQPFKVEMVVRGYLAGHAWREYRAGKRVLCGVPLPDGLKEADRLPTPIITPATKADEGHDEDITREELISRGLVPERTYRLLESYSLLLFERGTKMAAEKGLILVDTKYEFGEAKGDVYLIDEVHTPDSSRYYIAEGYDERQASGQTQKQLSKEFVREWLIENGFQGLDGQSMPPLTDAFAKEISARYIELFERITGIPFTPDTHPDPLARIEENVRTFLASESR
jgi:phosphoribosylaminoimidazole-succinocarboxamide synthase